MIKVIAFLAAVGFVAIGVVVCVAAGWIVYKGIVPLALSLLIGLCVYRFGGSIIKRIKEGRYANGEATEEEDSSPDERNT